MDSADGVGTRWSAGRSSYTWLSGTKDGACKSAGTKANPDPALAERALLVAENLTSLARLSRVPADQEYLDALLLAYGAEEPKDDARWEQLVAASRDGVLLRPVMNVWAAQAGPTGQIQALEAEAAYQAARQATVAAEEAAASAGAAAMAAEQAAAAVREMGQAVQEMH